MTGFSFSPDSLAVTNAAATVEVRIGASDFGSGVKEVYARLDGSGGVIWSPCALPALASGTAANGTWRCTITIPRASASGPWTFRTIAATDHVGNTTELMPEEIYARRYPMTVWVRN